jgi:hypothetical protein
MSSAKPSSTRRGSSPIDPRCRRSLLILANTRSSFGAGCGATVAVSAIAPPFPARGRVPSAVRRGASVSASEALLRLATATARGDVISGDSNVAAASVQHLAVLDARIHDKGRCRPGPAPPRPDLVVAGASGARDEAGRDRPAPCVVRVSDHRPAVQRSASSTTAAISGGPSSRARSLWSASSTSTRRVGPPAAPATARLWSGGTIPSCDP